MKKYILLSTLFIFLTACSTQDMAGLVNGNLANLIKIKKKTSNSRSYTRKTNCSYYDKKYGRYSSPAKACRRMDDCRKWIKYGTKSGPYVGCKNTNKRAQMTIDTYENQDPCYNWIDISMIEYNKCKKKHKAKRARRR